MPKKQRAKKSNLVGPLLNPILPAQMIERFYLPIEQASLELGVCATNIKVLSRKNHWKRWPYRSVNSELNRLIKLKEMDLQDAFKKSAKRVIARLGPDPLNCSLDNIQTMLEKQLAVRSKTVNLTPQQPSQETCSSYSKSELVTDEILLNTDEELDDAIALLINFQAQSATKSSSISIYSTEKPNNATFFQPKSRENLLRSSYDCPHSNTNNNL